MIRVQSVYRLMAYLFFAYSSITIVTSYLPVYFSAVGLTAGEIGVLMAVGPFAMILAQPTWGFLSDKYKSIKRMLQIALIGMIVAVFAFMGAASFAGYFIMMFVLFLFLSPTTALGDSLAQKTAINRRLSFGKIRMWGSLGFGFTSLAVGYILAAIGVTYIMVPLLVVTVISLWLSFGLEDFSDTTKPVTLLSALKLAIDPKIFFFLVCIVFITVTHRTNDIFLSIYIVELGGPESYIGWAWFIGVATEAAVLATSTLWFRKFSPIGFVIFAAVFYGVRWWLVSMVAVPWLLLPLQTLHGMTFGVFYVAAFAFVSHLIPKHLQATGHVLFISTTFGLSGIFGSLFGGWMIQAFSIPTLYSYLALSAFIGALGMTVYHFVYKKSFHPLPAIAEK